MTLFVGGPYDGQDFPVDPLIMQRLRLPVEERLDGFLMDPMTSGDEEWPYLYQADTTVKPPVYRFMRVLE